MARGFRHPTQEDYDPDPRRTGRFFEATSAIREWTTACFSAIGSLLFLGLILTLWAADISSCVRTTNSAKEGLTPRAPRPDERGESRLTERLTSLWQTSARPTEPLDLFVLDDASINAASLGRGIFILWTGLGTLPDDQLDAVIAHEIAHDTLQHSRKSAELRDVTDFVGEAIGVFGGRDESTKRTLKRWSGKLVVPRYDRAQELEADARAVDILAARQYPSPAAVICRAYDHLRSIEGEAGGGFFDSHPALTERIQALRTRFPSLATEVACQ